MKHLFTGQIVRVLLLSCLLVLPAAAQADYSGHPQAQAFIARMSEQHGFDPQELTDLLQAAEKKQVILDAIARPAEKTKSWAEYRKIFIKPERIQTGVKFWLENSAALRRAETTFGVPAEYIVAIIGVETLYGRITGNYRVIDALSTLAFDYPPRSPFFTKELENYLILMREHNQDPLVHKGSYAGAMGLGQFMPSSYRAYAVDFSGDQWPDIWNNKADAIGSVANYFYRHGWQAAQYVCMRARPEKNIVLDESKTIAEPAVAIANWRERGLEPVVALDDELLANAIALEGSLGTEYWVTMNNFYVITRYNRSAMYAMAVHQLAQAIYREGFEQVQQQETVTP